MNFNRTSPIAIRRVLKLNDGDKVAFVEKDGGYLIVNPTTLVFENIQKAFEGEAERLNLKDVGDVVAMVKEVRSERLSLIDASKSE